MNQFISLQTAIDMTGLYRSACENILKPEYQNQGILAFSEAFERQAFDTLLAKENCAGLRIYYGMSEDLKIHAIIVATDGKGNDILPSGNSSANESDDPDDDIAENGIRCPDICPPPSPLNQ
jgi:hypothetical protein